MNIFKFSKYFFILSLFFIIYSVFYINSNNLKYGLEFSGGTEVIIDFYEEVDIDSLRERVSFISDIDSTVQLYDENNYLIKFPFDQKTEFNVKDKLSKVFKEFYSDLNPNIVQIDFIGPKVGKELVQNGLNGYYLWFNCNLFMFLSGLILAFQLLQYLHYFMIF